MVGISLLVLAAPAGGATRYVFTTFTGDSAAKQKLSVYASTDGLTFTLMSNTGYGGPTGVLRDPSIMKHSDGNYYVAYTLQSWTTTSTSFAIASSSDLLNWTFLVEVPAQVPGVHDTWAPDWFKDTDGSINLIVNIDTLGTDSDFQSYKYTATNDTLTAWSAPTAMGIGPNYIDTFVVRVGTAYHAFSKNETSKYIEHATASSLTGPWSWVGTSNWAGFGSGKEGPALFQLDDGTWRMFMDCYNSCGYLYSTSSDLSSWSATAAVPGGLSGVVRHGAVLREEIGGSPGTGGSGGAASSGTNATGGSTTGGTNATGGSSAGGGGTGVGAGGTSATAGSGISGSLSGGAAAGGAPVVGGTTSAGSNVSGAIGGTAPVMGGATSTDSTVGGAAAGDSPIIGGMTSAGSNVGGATGGAAPAGGGATGTPSDSRGGCGCSLPTSRTPTTKLAALFAAWSIARRRGKRRHRNAS